MSRRATLLVLLALLAGIPALLPGPPAQALTDRWSGWAPITGSSNDYATTMRQRSPGFPEAAVATDSRGNVQIAGGASTFIGAGTPPGLKYGSSQGSPYLVLRPRADNAQAPSTTTYAFDHPTPDTGWAFVLGDVDADQVRVSATDEDGDPVPAPQVDSWFSGTFNHSGAADLPTWNGGTSTLVGNPQAIDTDGASGWFEPDVRLTSLTFVFTRRSGFPVYQTWFVSRARPIGGTVTDVSTLGDSCPIEDATLTLVSPYGEELGVTNPAPAPDGSYSFGEFATQGDYVVRVSAPPSCAVAGPAQATVDNRGNDGDPASLADFELREIVPQPISGTVLDDEGDAVPGVEVTLTRPGGGTVTTTTDADGNYLFDENPIADGYTLSIAVPAGYSPGPDGTEIDDIDVGSTPIEDQDFVIQQQPSVSGTVTGGGDGLGGVQVTLTPGGGGPALTAVTLGDGSYSLDGVPPGDYTISIDAPPGYTGDTSRPLTVGPGDIVDEDFALALPGAVAGQVSDDETGDPVADVEVTVDGPGPADVVTTDDTGAFFAGDLDAGDFTISITPPDGTEVVGVDTRQATITDAGGLVTVRGFVLQDVDDTSPTTPPTETPTTATPTEQPTTAGPSDSGTFSPGTTIPDTGGPPWWAAVLAFLLVAAGIALVAADRAKSRRRGPA